MSLKLYKINTTLNHPDCMAGFKKNDDEIFSFFPPARQILFFLPDPSFFML